MHSLRSWPRYALLYSQRGLQPVIFYWSGKAEYLGGQGEIANFCKKTLIPLLQIRGHENFAELPCKVSIPHTSISQAVHVAASIAMLEAVIVIIVTVCCLSESLDFAYGLVSVSILVRTVDIKPDIEHILYLTLA